MTAPSLAFRQDFAAPISTDVRPAVSAAEKLRAVLLEHQRDDGYWTDEWASTPATAGPVGVTAAAVIALIDSGMSPSEPEVARAVDWLWGRTVAPAAKDPDPPEVESLAALQAFLRVGRVAPHGSCAVVIDALEALREIQNDDGGWSMARNAGQIGEMSDAESTGEILTVLGLCGIASADAVVRAALGFLEREQDLDSGWADLNSTAAVLGGLQAVGVDTRWLPVRRAAEWVKRTQLAGGGGSAGPDALEAATAIQALRAAGVRPGLEIQAGIAWLAANPPTGAALSLLIAALAAMGPLRVRSSR